MNNRTRVPALLLSLTLLAGCAGTPTAAPEATAAEAQAVPQETAQPAGKEIPPTPPSTVPDQNGYYDFAQLFFSALRSGDAFAAASYMHFEDEQARALWLERFTPPLNARLVSVSALSLNLWAATVEEELGADIPPTQTVYYLAYYDGAYRVFLDPFSLPEDLIRDQSFAGMPLPVTEKARPVAKPGEDEYPPEEGQAENWYRQQQAELAAVKAAAEKAVRALPEAATVKSFDQPEIQLVDANSVTFLERKPEGDSLLVYRVSYSTAADALLGPITVYLDSKANVLGFGPRE